MRAFFANLAALGVDFILISGQAAVLYGAAPFSEDVDIWVRPARENLARLGAALARSDAVVHKLTPPLTLAMARRGHAFHFRLPATDESPTYLDVMARPPRVGSFARSLPRSTSLETSWGRMPVASFDDLVKLKLTRRQVDYEVISNLARLRVEGESKPARAALRWALETTYRVEDLLAWLLARPAARAIVQRGARPALRALARGLRANGTVREDAEGRADFAMVREIAARQAADKAYWRPIIRELRILRRESRLLEQGSPVLAPP